MPDPSVGQLGGPSETTELRIGDPKVNAASGSCCGKPRGCMMTHDGCLYLRHPWKRAMVFGDTAVRCQARATDPETGEDVQCALLNGHEGEEHPMVGSR